MMGNRYADLTKIPTDPLSRLMAVADMELSAEVDVPASADTEYVLRTLDAVQEWDDMIMVLAVALPAREAVWWSCLAAHDFVKAHPKTPRDSIRVAEAWVMEPCERTMKDIEVVLQNNSPTDKTSLCATAALYANGTMGSGDMAEIPAPPSAVAATVFGMNMLAMSEAEDPETYLQWLIDRGLDIARGGNGKVRCPEPRPIEYDDDDEDEDDVDETVDEDAEMIEETK